MPWSRRLLFDLNSNFTLNVVVIQKPTTLNPQLRAYYCFVCHFSGTHFHWCLLGQMCGQPRLKAGLQDRNLLTKLRWALYWHHLSYYQPLHSDGAERWTLILEDISPRDCLILQKQSMMMEETWNVVSAKKIPPFVGCHLIVSVCGTMNSSLCLWLLVWN